MNNKPTFKKGDLVKYFDEASAILKLKGNLGIIIKKPARFYQVGHRTKVYFFAAKQAYWLYIDELKKLSK